MGSLSWGSRAEREQLKSDLLAIEANPVLLGRFVVARKLGAGATGVVLEAYDPKLERGVALKVLRTEFAEEPQLQVRLQREARALARLSHPHVVSVFEVGQHEGHTFIVMELLRGPTLRSWLRQRDRPWREILAVFVASGSGLAAAHASDLVHRDFKPENVLLTAAGVPTVVDFGLVSPQSMPTTGGADDPRLTEQPVGTPQYMAPEQLRGEPADARADQYSFCVALHEALTEHVAGAAPPRAVLDAIARGRSEDAGQRWPAFSGLLDALRSAAGATRRRLQWGVGCVAVVVGASALVSMRRAEPREPCGDPAVLEAVWSPAQAEAVQERQWGPVVSARLDAYAARWQQAAAQACRTRVDRASDGRMMCLQHHLLTLDTYVRSLPEEGPLPIVAFPSPEACLEPQPSAEPSEGVAEAVARARGANLAGDYEASARWLDAADEAVSTHDNEAGTGDVLYGRGQLSEIDGRYEDALQFYEEGFHFAYRSRRESALIRNLIGVIRIEVGYLNHLERGAFWVELGQRFVGEDHPDVYERIAFLNVVAALYITRGDLERGEALVTKGIADARALPEAESMIRLLQARSSARGRMHDFEGAADDARLALAKIEETYGASHHAAGEACANLGSALRQMGDLPGALTVLKRALAIYMELHGPQHPDTGQARLNLSAVYFEQDDLEAAAKQLEGLPELFDSTLGAHHPWTAVAMRNVCIVATARGKSDGLVSTCRRALKAAEDAYGREHYETAQAMLALVDALEAVGESTEAAAVIQQAAEVLAPNYPLDAAVAKQQRAELLHAAGRDSEAIVELDEVVALPAPDDDMKALIDEARALRASLEDGT